MASEKDILAKIRQRQINAAEALTRPAAEEPVPSGHKGVSSEVFEEACKKKDKGGKKPIKEWGGGVLPGEDEDDYMDPVSGTDYLGGSSPAYSEDKEFGDDAELGYDDEELDDEEFDDEEFGDDEELGYEDEFGDDEEDEFGNEFDDESYVEALLAMGNAEFREHLNEFANVTKGDIVRNRKRRAKTAKMAVAGGQTKAERKLSAMRRVKTMRAKGIFRKMQKRRLKTLARRSRMGMYDNAFSEGTRNALNEAVDGSLSPKQARSIMARVVADMESYRESADVEFMAAATTDVYAPVLEFLSAIVSGELYEGMEENLASILAEI